MTLKNGVEVLRWSPDNEDTLSLKAYITDTWEQGAFLYWDGTYLRKFAPADSTAFGTNQSSIIGIASSGKLSGQIEATVCKKAEVLMDATTPLLGAAAVVCYTAATGKYYAYEGAAYNVAYEPDITLTLDFLTFKQPAVEADHRCVMQIDGTARFLALN